MLRIGQTVLMSTPGWWMLLLLCSCSSTSQFNVNIFLPSLQYWYTMATLGELLAQRWNNHEFLCTIMKWKLQPTNVTWNLDRKKENLSPLCVKDLLPWPITISRQRQKIQHALPAIIHDTAVVTTLPRQTKRMTANKTTNTYNKEGILYYTSVHNNNIQLNS